MSGRDRPAADRLTGDRPGGRVVASASWLLPISLAGLAIGLVSTAVDAERIASASLTATTAIGLVLSTWWLLKAVREHRIGVDVVAVLALAGSLLVDELLAGALITVMLATGRSLERWAAGRAEHDLHALLERSPTMVHRHHGSSLVDVPLIEVSPGDLLLVRPGDVVPVDGTLRSELAVLDESALTGEPLPVGRRRNDALRSGVVNAGGPFDLLATTDAEGSTYAGIVRLVREASASTSRLVRVADRYALAFVVVAVAVALSAWIVSGDARRAVAVLVVATPCPLILAVPVAIVAGLSRCARKGVIVKGGRALEALANVNVLLLDKTGTLTQGRPTVTDVIPAPEVPAADVLRLAASLDQVSPHLLAASIVAAAASRGGDLVLPTDVSEVAGSGIRGAVSGVPVTVGTARWVGAAEDEGWVRLARRRSEIDGSSVVFVGRADRAIGAILLADPLRVDATRTVRALRQSGIRRIVVVTGDRRQIAVPLGAMLSVDEVRAEQSPADKVAAVSAERGPGRSVVMVGDGINDAPALAAADVGVAVGRHASAASAEAADVVLTAERLDRLGDARLIARRSRVIATQSVRAGMALSLVAMAVAATGHLRPAAGALLQELIDVAAIVNALRALRPAREEIRLDQHARAMVAEFAAEHTSLRPTVSLLRDAAAALGRRDPGAMSLVRRAYTLLTEQIEPHERHEDERLYPAVADALGGADPTATMSRAHAEISKLTAQMGLVLERIDRDVPDAEDSAELQRLLYGLYAVLELHFTQEDESYLSLAEDQSSTRERGTFDPVTNPHVGGRCAHGADRPHPRS